MRIPWTTEADVRTESELRDELQRSIPGSASRIDADAIIRKAKARRAPRQVAFGSVAVLAVAGFAVLGTSALPSLFPSSTGASDSAGMSAPESSISEKNGDHFGAAQSDANRVLTGQCGRTAVSPPPSSLGLTLTPSFPTPVSRGSQPVTGTVTLTNTGTSPVRGSTSFEPVIELARNGMTVWHTSGSVPSLGRLIDLAPGESTTYSASFTPVECTSEDETGIRFRDNLPPLDFGDVTLTAAIQFIPDGATGEEAVIISGPPQTITLR